MNLNDILMIIGITCGSAIVVLLSLYFLSSTLNKKEKENESN